MLVEKLSKENENFKHEAWTKEEKNGDNTSNIRWFQPFGK